MGRPLPAIVAAACILLCACDPRPIPGSDLKPHEIEPLAGLWEGTGRLRLGVRECPDAYIWSFRVADGVVDGRIIDPETPNAQPSTFRTFVDYEGGMAATARPGGRETVIRGAFLHDAFRGEAINKDCTYNVRVGRKEFK